MNNKLSGQYPYGYCPIHGKQPGYPGRTDCHVIIHQGMINTCCGKRLTSKQENY